MMSRFFVTCVCTLVIVAGAAHTWAIDFLAPAHLDLSGTRMGVVTGKPVEPQVQCALGIVGGTNMVFLQHGQQPLNGDVIFFDGALPAGAKLVNVLLLSNFFCTGSNGLIYDLYRADVVNSPNQATVLFEVDPGIAIATDERGVVTGNVAQDGSHKVVFVRKGEPNMSVWVTFDMEMEMGDFLTDIEQIYADEWGTIFVGTIEY